MDKNDLIKKAIEGDKTAVIELIKAEKNNIYSTLYYLKKNNDELNDILQNVLIKLSTKIHQLKNPVYFKTWLNKLTVNTYLDYIRKKKKTFDVVLKENSENFDITDNKNNPQDKIIYSELENLIESSIENLPIKYRIPITLREIEGMSYFDISNITKTSIGTIKSRISRARSIIKSKIDKYSKEY